MVNKKVNFLKPKKFLRFFKKRRLKILWYFLGFVGFILISAGVLVAVYWAPSKQLIKDSTNGKEAFLKAERLLLDQDFSGAQIMLGSAITDFESSKALFKKFLWLQKVPWIGTQIQAVDNIFSVGITTGQSIKKVASVASSVVTPLTKNKDVSLSALTPQEKHQLLENIYNAKPQLEEAKISINEAVASIDKIPSHGLIRKLSDIIDPLKKQVPQLQSGLDQAVTISQILPLVAGYPEKKSYLFLLENNAELAPSGGFIGTYGILKIKDGDISSFTTDNVYNLDVPAEAWLNIDAPWPVAKYNAAPKLFLRGASWSPDFPTTAQSAQWFYRMERGPEKKIDGTVAITPTFIESLLTLTGDIKVGGLTFTSTNFTDILQDQVERGFLKQGVPLSQRKEIIGVLSKEILDDVLALPKSRWPDLWNIVKQNIDQKQILLYSNDEFTQNMILKENWGGDVKDVSHDYVAVIDANLASLKSDPVVKRTLNYQVKKDGDKLIADLYFTYKNEGKITWKTTRYRTYARVYVPSGSTLLASDGPMIDCKNPKKGSVETTQELNKTVFGAFICTEPGESQTLHYQYQLPQRILDQVNEGQYQLLVQKQAGTGLHGLVFKFDFKKTMKSLVTSDNNKVLSGQALEFTDILSQDRAYSVNF